MKFDWPTFIGIVIGLTIGEVITESAYYNRKSELLQLQKENLKLEIMLKKMKLSK